MGIISRIGLGQGLGLGDVWQRLRQVLRGRYVELWSDVFDPVIFWVAEEARGALAEVGIPFTILAQIRSDFDLAWDLLEKTLYLDPQNIAGTLELAALCERTNNMKRAQTLRRAALEILRSLPGDTVVEQYETTAAEMVQQMT